MSRLAHFASLVTLAALGCGGEVVVLGAPGDGGGAAGAGGSGAGPTTTSASGGAPPVTTTVGGGGPLPACGSSTDRFAMAFYTASGSLWGCDAMEKSDEGAAVVDGVVVSTDEASILVDSCLPNETCVQDTLSLLEFSADGLQHDTPVGTYVRVAVAVEAPMSCAHQVVVQNLPIWLDFPNPVDASERIWLAGADGAVSLGLESDVTVELRDGCTPGDGGTERSLFFDWGGGSAELPMLEELSDGEHAMRNLRSYAPALDDHEVGWWFTSLLVPPG